MIARQKPKPAEIKKLIDALQAIKINDVLYIDRKAYNCVHKIIGTLEYRYPVLITEYTLYPNPYYHSNTQLQ